MSRAALVTVATFVLLASASVHAQDRIAENAVTDRATLRAFVEDPKEYLEGITTLTEIARLCDVFRADGLWKAGPLFLTILTRNGTIIIHGDDPTPENTEIIAARDEGGRPVVKAPLDTAWSGGDFVDSRWDDAGRTVYPVEYASGLTGKKLVFAGGFLKDPSPVPARIEPSLRPELTTAEIVDHEPLATFLNAAAKAFRDAMLTAGMHDLRNTKNAPRLEGGDRKAGSVDVFVIGKEGDTLFLWGFPIGFESHQFEDVDCEDVNSVRYLRELLATGEAGGGYLESMFDNPAVQADKNTGSPNIAYAVRFGCPTATSSSWSHPGSTPTLGHPTCRPTVWNDSRGPA
ncbi:MAG: hypothetical protein OXI81_03225 [Paracoccaceae bacterium]|nr:hypothetical protein [Paracoccaceae bacterium]